jgi:hypothetical protein
MQKILISHESPISLLDKSRQYNDFDYLLCHLYFQEPRYKDYFINARKVYNREVFADTSIFELGKAFDSGKYATMLSEVRPSAYIVPDILEDSQGTIDNYKKFVDVWKHVTDELDGQKVGAVQGKAWSEILKCYQFMSDNADVIAISFDFSYYQITGEGETWEQKMVTGRQRLIEQLIDRGVWNWKKPHHLLGAALPQEFAYYRNNNIYSIRSLDTSNPVVHGLNNIQYNSTFGLKSKLRGTLLADLINAIPTKEQEEIIDYNISQFRKIVNG